MSRSFNKNKIIKDKSRHSKNSGKTIGNKMFRRKSKEKTKLLLEDELPHDKSEVINDYNVSDYWFFAWGNELKGKLKKLFK